MDNNTEQPASNTRIRLWCSGRRDIDLTPNEMRIAQERMKQMKIVERQWNQIDPANR